MKNARLEPTKAGGYVLYPMQPLSYEDLENVGEYVRRMVDQGQLPPSWGASPRVSGMLQMALDADYSWADPYRLKKDCDRPDGFVVEMIHDFRVL